MPSNDHKWLTELTSLPTAAGREDAVIQWIEKWVKRRRTCRLKRDRFGNLLIERAVRGKRRAAGQPIFFTAHMDHPAFVVREVIDDRHVAADFRGGVREAYFVGSRVQWFGQDGNAEPVKGRVVGPHDAGGGSGGDKCWRIRLSRGVDAQPGDILTWDVGRSRIARGRLHAPACDDLAGLAAALAAFDQLSRRKTAGRVAVLLTRCEEVGFIGAIAACESGIIPKDARLIALENSKSFAESPIGGGPIVRVGDRTSTFDPDLTYRVGHVAQQLAAQNSTFRWQRKLMPGGTCEASAYQTFGYTATCVCLPLGNYHNMDEDNQCIAAETISISDFDHLVTLLVGVGTSLDDEGVTLRERLDRLYASRKALLD